MEHQSVLTKEVIKYLSPNPNDHFIDATVGFGGHAYKILKKTAPSGKLLAFDWDNIALLNAKEKLKEFGKRCTFINKNFSEIGLVIKDWQVDKVSGILFDLGTSNYQLTDKNRGFSFRENSELDMRMSPNSQKLSAKDIVNKFSEFEIRKILFDLGEEKFAKTIARNIVTRRREKFINTTQDLVGIIKNSVPPRVRVNSKIHFATNTFRALRMVVNKELDNLENALKQALQILSPGGRIVVISFHSLEDRIVKNFFKNSDLLEVVTMKPVMASVEELEKNPRARSAKLRGAIKGESC
jgi:16S rRNA (cytosine1402-N4)-methyltransferase